MKIIIIIIIIMIMITNYAINNKSNDGNNNNINNNGNNNVPCVLLHCTGYSYRAPRLFSVRRAARAIGRVGPSPEKAPWRPHSWSRPCIMSCITVIVIIIVRIISIIISVTIIKVIIVIVLMRTIRYNTGNSTIRYNNTNTNTNNGPGLGPRLRRDSCPGVWAPRARIAASLRNVIITTTIITINIMITICSTSMMNITIVAYIIVINIISGARLRTSQPGGRSLLGRQARQMLRLPRAAFCVLTRW